MPKKKRNRTRSRNSSKKLHQATLPPQERKSPISLCMIVKDEENFLPDCLASVQEMVGEIIIVDTGSTDRTIEFAHQFNCSVFNYKWKEDFAAARNFALSRTTLPWILYLDADERLNREFHEIVLQAVKKNSADAFYLKVHSPVSGILGNVPHIQAYPRLFKKLRGARFEGKIHEQITPSLKRVKARFQYLDATIEHLGYIQTDEILKNKIERNLKYLREQVQNEPGNAYAWFQLGQTLLLNKQKEQGIKYLKKAINFKTLPNNLTSTSLLMIGNEYFEKKKINDALLYVNEALKLAPRQKLGYFLKSECYAKKFEWQKAITNLEKLIEYSDIPFSDISIEKTFDPYLIEQRLALYYFNLQDFNSCMGHFQNYFDLAASIRHNLVSKWAHAWQKLGSPRIEGKKILVLFKQKLENVDDKTETLKILAGIAEQCNDKTETNYYLNLAFKYNSKDPMILYYLGNLELENGNLASAEKYFFKALKEKDDVWEIHYNLAVVKIRQNLFQEAISVLESALQVFPEKRASVNRLLGGLYAKVGDFNMILEQLTPTYTEG